MPGGTIRYVPLHPPKDGATRTSPASEWTIDFQELENTINHKTKMIVRTPQLFLVIPFKLTLSEGFELSVSTHRANLSALQLIIVGTTPLARSSRVRSSSASETSV